MLEITTGKHSKPESYNHVPTIPDDPKFLSKQFFVRSMVVIVLLAAVGVFVEVTMYTPLADFISFDNSSAAMAAVVIYLLAFATNCCVLALAEILSMISISSLVMIFRHRSKS